VEWEKGTKTPPKSYVVGDRERGGGRHLESASSARVGKDQNREIVREGGSSLNGGKFKAYMMGEEEKNTTEKSRSLEKQ